MLVEEISVADLHALGAEAVLIDVRELDEWVDGRVPHARHVVLGSVPDQLHQFAGAPTYVICKIGGRSLRACEFAAAQGHHVVNVTGGMLAWRSAGFDVTTGSDVIDA